VQITLYTGRQDGDGKQAAWLNGSMLLELHGTKGQAGPLLLNTVFESDSGVAVFLVRALEVGAPKQEHHSIIIYVLFQLTGHCRKCMPTAVP
jgi:hypothetical protein